MRTNITEPAEVDAERSARVGGRQTREIMRDAALRNAIRKRAEGVPTYTVPEAAALLSISQEYLYRLIQADSFPAVRMRIGRAQGRYVVPAKVVERLLDDAAAAANSLDLAEWTERAALSGGAA
ncbi:helix-turn-helix domain-containing protein [Thermocrispum municipale]|uniref:helix-turn-helix domain-containing protein n=1 Tax=Thermocrispum municipale TaxID=37926 RepID=UPI00041A52FB|nr:helix-turn-helix domain-containing protein [Thermocrispum municipale]